MLPPEPGKRVEAILLIAAMAAASLVLWIGVPVLWLFIGSRIQQSSSPSMGTYVLVLAGIIASMVGMTKLLSHLNRRYLRLTGTTGAVHVQLPWHRSMRGERTSGRPTTVLDVVMIGSVTVAAVAFGIWFFFLAGSPF